VTCDKTDEGGKDGSFGAFRALDDLWDFACGRDGEGNICLGVAVVVLPASAPGVDSGGGRCSSLVANGVKLAVIGREGTRGDRVCEIPSLGKATERAVVRGPCYLEFQIPIKGEKIVSCLSEGKVRVVGLGVAQGWEMWR
jgi:hypothetical protein